MARSRPGQLEAGVAILGLLVQRPDSIAGLGVRLGEEYPSAGWPTNIVHNTVPSLAGKGLIRIARRGVERSLDVWEPEPDGSDFFERWRREPSAAPVFRDALWARLKHVTDEAELRDLLIDIRRREQSCLGKGTEAMARYRNARASGELTMRGPRDVSRVGRRAAHIAEIRHWYKEAKEWRRLRRWLEDPDGAEHEIEGWLHDG